MLEINLDFCDSCEHRGRVIEGTGSFCARTALDNVVSITNIMPPDHTLPSLDLDTGAEETVAEFQTTFSEQFTQEAAACIEQVRAGGKPVIED